MIFSSPSRKRREKLFDSQGFTVVELLIVFAIISVLSGLGITSYVSFSRSQALNAAVSEIKGILGQAKSRAASQVKPLLNGNPHPNCGDETLDGYEVNLCSVGSTGCANSTCTTNGCFELNARCGGSSVPIVISTGKLTSGYTFKTSAPASQSKFFFPVLRGGVVVNGGTLPQGEIYIDSGEPGNFRQISVDKDGNIN